ncbi:MAG: hypothetical protein KAV87_24915 [Desulfobacteraceae bacterium]|nr:hypothetical protein [Desulfobacteraceae bacterium]
MLPVKGLFERRTLGRKTSRHRKNQYFSVMEDLEKNLKETLIFLKLLEEN